MDTQYFVCNFNCKKIYILGSVADTENTTFFDHPILKENETASSYTSNMVFEIKIAFALASTCSFKSVSASYSTKKLFWHLHLFTEDDVNVLCFVSGLSRINYASLNLPCAKVVDKVEAINNPRPSKPVAVQHRKPKNGSKQVCIVIVLQTAFSKRLTLAPQFFF